MFSRFPFYVYCCWASFAFLWPKLIFNYYKFVSRQFLCRLLLLPMVYSSSSKQVLLQAPNKMTSKARSLFYRIECMYKHVCIHKEAVDLSLSALWLSLFL